MSVFPHGLSFRRSGCLFWRRVFPGCPETHRKLWSDPVGMDAEIGGRSPFRQIESGRTVEAEITKPVFSQKPYDFLAGWLDGHVCRVFNGTALAKSEMLPSSEKGDWPKSPFHAAQPEQAVLKFQGAADVMKIPRGLLR